MKLALVPYEFIKIKLNFLLIVFIIILGLFAAPVPLISQNLKYEILNNDHQVVIPFEYENNFIIVKLIFHKSLEVKFIIDTGAEFSVFTIKQVADLFGLNYTRTIKILGSDYKTFLSAYLSQGVDFDMGNLSIKSKEMLVLKEDFLGYDMLTETNVVGLIGSDILSNFVVKIDYKNKRMTLIKPEYFKPSGKLNKMPLEIWKQKPYVTLACKINDNKSDSLKFLLDTGAGLALLLLKGTHPSIKVPDKVINGRLGLGLGGYLEGILGRIQSVRFGETDFNSIVANFQDRAEFVDVLSKNGRHGIVGNSLLSNFDIYIDYQNAQLYSSRNRRKIKEMELDKSGILIFVSGEHLNQFIIRDITPGSPAFLADLRNGDIITSINHWPTFLFTSNRIHHLLSSKEGKLIKMTLIRDGKKIKKQFKLQKLI